MVTMSHSASLVGPDTSKSSVLSFVSFIALFALTCPIGRDIYDRGGTMAIDSGRVGD